MRQLRRHLNHEPKWRIGLILLQHFEHGIDDVRERCLADAALAEDHNVQARLHNRVSEHCDLLPAPGEQVPRRIGARG